MTTFRAALIVVLVAAVTACAPMRRDTASRYQGIMLNGRDLGAGEIDRLGASDPTLASYVASHSQPDFVYVATPTDVELVYRARSTLAHFHRPAPDAPSVVTEVTPLPNGVLNVLPADPRAGTPAQGAETDQPLLASCWRTPAGGGECRTCCKGPIACSTSCTGGDVGSR